MPAGQELPQQVFMLLPELGASGAPATPATAPITSLRSQRREEKRGSDHRRGRALWVCLWVCLPILLLGLAYYYQLPQEQELQRLHRHAVDVTLDPNTAAPKLILSEDGKQVRHGDKRQVLPDNPERFDLSPCVLGKEGFSSGRHYWEVEVGEKTDWDLGVARESISRKGQITLSPEDGYWTVWLRIGNEYEALDDPSVLLPLSLKPRTVGVFVDYEGGQVSFYNVEARSHIYTFTVVCTDAPSVARVEELLDGFCRATGAAVNKAKSDVYLSRAWPPTVFPVKPFIKVLVITIDGTNTGTRSWEEALSKVQRKIHGWSTRTLTMAGKVLVIKAILFPILLYVGMIFPPDKVIAKLVTRIIFRFVWGSKMERLKRVQMVKGTLDGGRGILDGVRLIKAQGLAYVVKNIQAAGKKVSFMNRFYFASSLRPFSLCAMDNTRPHSWDPPPFYRVLRAFALEVGLHKVVLASWDYKTICSQMRSTQETSRIEDFPPETCRFIWDNATHICLTNTQKDVSWMAVSRCLPTRVFMHRRGIAPYDICPYKGCLGKETEAHIFRDCPSACRVWLLFSPFLRRLAVPVQATAQKILYGPARGLTSSTLRCWWHVVCAVKQALWEGRNICLFNKQELDPVVIARRGMILVRDYINLEVHQRGKEEAFKNWQIQDLGELRIP
ncbi:uncharacterized protein LOC136767313 [Amia ocellicauda]|uniref:uncharacterized protein LOC136767313 n=1 Tax=Amia ocellicauda TaxID=2972642 RepID=UPI00346406C5